MTSPATNAAARTGAAPTPTGPLSKIDYSERIPNNVNLADDRRLQRALEGWQPASAVWRRRATARFTVLGIRSELPLLASGPVGAGAAPVRSSMVVMVKFYTSLANTTRVCRLFVTRLGVRRSPAAILPG